MCRVDASSSAWVDSLAQEHEHPFLQGLNEQIAGLRTLTSVPEVARQIDFVPLASFNALRRSGVVLPPLEDILEDFPRMTKQEIQAYTEIANSQQGLRVQQLEARFPSIFSAVSEVELRKPSRSAVAYIPADSQGMALARSLVDKYNSPSVTNRIKARAPMVQEIVADMTPIADAKLSDIQASRGAVKPSNAGFLESLESRVLDTRGYQADVRPGKKASVKVVPKKSGARKLLGSLPFIGAAIDVGMGVSDVVAGDYREGLAHFGDAAIGATGVGEVANLALGMATDSEGVATFVEDQL